MPLNFSPPLLNSASPWATTKEDLQALYDCPYTGAVTTRTCTDSGFAHDDQIHQYSFFDSDMRSARSNGRVSEAGGVNSINSLGYSPIPLSVTLDGIKDVVSNSPESSASRGDDKPFIVSITGTAYEVAEMYLAITRFQQGLQATRLLVEINLSCPNIVGKPSPAYSKEELDEYIKKLHHVRVNAEDQPAKKYPDLGLKLPPFTYSAQFDHVIEALTAVQPCPISFLTSTNTLGSALSLDTDENTAINTAEGTGIGGLAGQAIHPLSLGNVKTLRRKLDADEGLKRIEIIGVGGVRDHQGARRMKAVGAAVVVVATALGFYGVDVFARIAGEEEDGASMV
jgi:dihydroorotate dehydrogenase (fumarate)